MKTLLGILGCSESYGNRTFKKRYGSTPGDDLLGLRLERSVHLLVSRPSLAVAEVGRRSGFGSYQTFYRNFAQRFGMPPSEYRKRHRDLSKTAPNLSDLA